MAFTASTIHSTTTNHPQIYECGDIGTLVVDVVLVAAMVTAVCLMVIGKMELGLGGEVGTFSNASVQAMLAVSGIMIVLDGLCIAVKAYLGKAPEEKQKVDSGPIVMPPIADADDLKGYRTLNAAGYALFITDLFHPETNKTKIYVADEFTPGEMTLYFNITGNKFVGVEKDLEGRDADGKTIFGIGVDAQLRDGGQAIALKFDDHAVKFEANKNVSAPQPEIGRYVGAFLRLYANPK
jgi:hypothetical protein